MEAGEETPQYFAEAAWLYQNDGGKAIANLQALSAQNEFA